MSNYDQEDGRIFFIPETHTSLGKIKFLNVQFLRFVLPFVGRLH